MRSPGIAAAAASIRPRAPAAAGALAWLIGLGLIAGLIVAYDADQVVAASALAGWSIGLVGLAHLGTLVADTLGWRALLRKPERPSLLAMAIRRWIGASVNALLPVAQVGGEFVRARLLARAGVPGSVAGASVVVDVTTGLVTQVVFVLLGMGLYLGVQGDADWLLQAGAGLAAFSLLLLGFSLLQRRGLFLRLARILERIAGGWAWRGLVGNAAALDREIVARYQDRVRLATCAAWRLLGWLWGSVEVWLAFWLLGHPVSIAEAVILESLGQTVRSIGFMLPGGLGAQEGGIVAGGMILGVGPDLALAVALIKRARELIYGVPGLFSWALLDLGRRKQADRRRRSSCDQDEQSGAPARVTLAQQGRTTARLQV
jgi:putative membrane protein